MANYNGINVMPDRGLSTAAGVAQGAQNFMSAYQGAQQRSAYMQMMQQQQQSELQLRNLQMQKLQQEISPVQMDVQKLSMLSKMADSNEDVTSVYKGYLSKMMDGLDSPTKIAYANQVLDQHLANQSNQPNYLKGSEQDPNFRGPPAPVQTGSQYTEIPGPVQPGQAPLGYDKPIMGYPPAGTQTQLPTQTPSEYVGSGYKTYKTPAKPGEPFEVGDGYYRKDPNAATAAPAVDQRSQYQKAAQGVPYSDLSQEAKDVMSGKMSLNPYEQKVFEKMLTARAAANAQLGRNAVDLRKTDMNNMTKEELRDMINHANYLMQDKKDNTRLAVSDQNNQSKEGIADANNASRESIANGRNATAVRTQGMRSGAKGGSPSQLDDKSINKQIEVMTKQMGDLRKPNPLTGMTPTDDMIKSSEAWYRSNISALEQKRASLRGSRPQSQSAPASQPSGLPVVAKSKEDIMNAQEGALINFNGAMYIKRGKQLIPAQGR